MPLMAGGPVVGLLGLWGVLPLKPAMVVTIVLAIAPALVVAGLGGAAATRLRSRRAEPKSPAARSAWTRADSVTGVAQSELQRQPWQAAVAPYARPDISRACLDVVTSVVPYLA